MKLCIIALDYDGTIARHGRADPSVLEAVEHVRSRGIVVILVTGRILSELRRVLPQTKLFDAIVAENGAVIAFPNGRRRTLARAPSPDLLDELSRRGVATDSGDCIIDAEASSAVEILKVIQKLELPLALTFNRNRVMILPQGINKATGLRAVLNTMRLSLHNCVGMGDAENDHAMLEACEIGVAVSWGSKSLRAIADHVLEGDGPAAVGAYIRALAQETKLPPQRADSRRILLGHTAAGDLVEATVRGRNILVCGDPRSGKSWITGLFCEQLILDGYCLCVVDPEGDYATLEPLPGVVVFQASEPRPRLSDVARALRYPDVSVVLDLSGLAHEPKLAYVHELLPMIASLRRNSGLPHWIVLDEAHYFLHDTNFAECVDCELAAYVVITYRPSQLHPELTSALDSAIVTPFTNREEIEALARMFDAQDASEQWAELFGRLGIDEAAVLTHAKAPQRFTIADRVTSHVRHRSKYVDVPMPLERSFVFTSDGEPFGPPARTLREFVRMQERLSVAALHAHARRGDFSRWIREAFGDAPLATDVQQLEEQLRAGELEELRPALVKVIRARYALPRPKGSVPATPRPDA
jgi:hydroxymethylpyrimidine pyrophosphatase-like HAD family hydrolase